MYTPTISIDSNYYLCYSQDFCDMDKYSTCSSLACLLHNTPPPPSQPLLPTRLLDGEDRCTATGTSIELASRAVASGSHTEAE